MKILVLSSSTGEGHNSAAKAVMEALSMHGAECELIDPLAFKSEGVMKKLASIYNNMISKVPKMFGFIYKIGAFYEFLRLPSPVAWANSTYAGKLAEYIKAHGFDAVVGTHIFSMQAMLAVKKKYGVTIPTYTVMTDYVPIPFYKDLREHEGHFVPTKETKESLIKKGFSEQSIFISGIPVSPKFTVDTPKADLRQNLGIDDDTRVISALSGGAGCGNMVKLCKMLDKDTSEKHIIFVFPGKNPKLKDKLLAAFKDSANIKVVDFTPDINLYIKASDVVLSKPGGLSSTEIAVAGVPLVHLKAIPGCETYNVRYFGENGLSIPTKNFKEATAVTALLLKDSDKAEEMVKKQRELIKRDAQEKIAKHILGIND